VTLAEKIVAVARERGLDLREVAQRASIGYSTLTSYTRTRNSRVPTAPRGVALAKALGVPTEWLFDESQGMPTPPRLEGPPFPIEPWPPNGVTWEVVRRLLAAYQARRFIEILGGVVQELEGRPDLEVALQEQARTIIDVFKRFVAIYELQDDQGKQLLDKVIPALNELASFYSGNEAASDG
jgi:transcriptional regulator with XRE-family HTH domain